MSCSVNFFFGDIIFFFVAKEVLAKLSRDVPDLVVSLTDGDNVDEESSISVAVELCCQRLNLFWREI